MSLGFGERPVVPSKIVYANRIVCSKISDMSTAFIVFNISRAYL